MVTELFKEHASPEAIRAAIREVLIKRNRLGVEVTALGNLLNLRLAQIRKGEWPVGGDTP